jgi:hypothetical protein
MSNADFSRLVELLLTFAPPDWIKMRVQYRYYNSISDTKTYAITPASPDWKRVGHGGFKMMDFFDAYRAQTHPNMAQPWTTINVTVERGNLEPDVQFGYDVPNMRDAT